MDPNLTPPPQADNNQPPQEKNIMAILGLIFAFSIPLLGLILSIIGMNKAKEMNDNGRSLALAGIWVSIVFMVVSPVLLVLVLVAAPSLQRNVRDSERVSDVLSLQSQIREATADADGQLPTEGSGGTFANTVLSTWNPDYYSWAADNLVTSNMEDSDKDHILYVQNGQPSSDTYYPSADSIHIWGGSKCASDFSEKLSGGGETYAAGEIEPGTSRTYTYASVYYLEDAGGQIVCEDNS